MKKILLLMLSIMIITTLQAKEKKQTTKTQIETFIAKKGIVIIKSYTTIGTIKCLYGSKIEIELREFTNASNKIKIYGIAISVNNGKEYSNEHSSYIDFTEISSLIKGIKYILKIDSSVTSLSHFEATYSTVDELSITIFNANHGLLSAISSGRIGQITAYCTLPKLTEINTLIQKAYQEIKLMKSKR